MVLGECDLPGSVCEAVGDPWSAGCGMGGTHRPEPTIGVFARPVPVDPAFAAKVE
jgi:hypothetical protein